MAVSTQAVQAPEERAETSEGGVTLRAVVLGLLPDGGDLCEQTDVAPRLEALVGMAPQGLTASVCEPDYGPIFAEAVDLITQTCDDFVPPVPEG